jgi:hypothetical protein
LVHEPVDGCYHRGVVSERDSTQSPSAAIPVNTEAATPPLSATVMAIAERDGDGDR